MTQKITKFGRPEHAIVSAAILAALTSVEQELGVKFGVSGGEIGSSKGVIKVSVNVQDTGNGKSGAQTEWEALCQTYGLLPSWFGQTFYVDGTQYRITGLNLNAPKYAVAAERVSDSRSMKFTPAGIKTAMSRMTLKLGKAA